MSAVSLLLITEDWCAGDVRKRAASGKGPAQRILTTPKKAVQAPLPEEPAESDESSHAAAEAVENESDMSQGEVEEDPFPVEPLQSPARDAAGKWEPYKKPKNVRSLDLDCICMTQPKKPRTASVVESDSPQ